MSLCVLNVAYPLAPVGPDAVGGAEQVLSHLDAALVRAGHRSMVLGCDGSVAAGELQTIPRQAGELTDAARQEVWQMYREAVRQCLERWPVDLVHLHGIDFHEYLPPGVPTLVTLHLPPGWYPPAALRPNRPRTWFNCVSRSQQAACPPDREGFIGVIENGVPVEELAARHARRGFVLGLGRICPEKGFHLALDACHRSGVSMLLAGEVFRYPAHEGYFRLEITPRLDRQRRFLGPVGFARKRRLLSAARCLVVPSLALETSSLVAMESLACGTPVIAFPAGALADIVEHGRTGFLVRDVSEMADAIAAVGGIDPEACRAAAREHFSLTRTACRYLQLYAELVERGETRRAAGVRTEAPSPRITIRGLDPHHENATPDRMK